MDSQAPFFRPGGTLEPGAESYIARDADAQLLAALMAGEYVFLLDSRQKGKSSLVARTLLALRDHGVATIKLDLQRIGANVTPEQWYAGLLSGIGQELGISKEVFAYWEDKQFLGPLARWLGAIESVVLSLRAGPIVVFIDEVDFVRTLPFSTDEFFAGIRDCYNRRAGDPAFRRLTFCLVGVATPGQLIRNPEITPFNIGTRISLSDFTLQETKAYETVLDSPGRVGKQLLERVHYWVNGHPYLTQLLCSHLAVNPTVNSSQGVDRLVRDLFFTPEARHREPNLADVERRILDPDVPGLSTDEKRTQVLELYGKILRGERIEVAEENPVVATLRLSGLGFADRLALRVRNRLYRVVFDEGWRRQNLPEAELRRQRRAARVALLRTASVACIVLLGVTTVAFNTSRLSNERRQALTDLNKRTEDLANTSNQRKRALTTLEQQNLDLSRLSRERQKALQDLQLRTEELNRVSGEREQTIEELKASTVELDRQNYNAILGSIQFAIAANDARRATALADKIKASPYRGWEWGYVSLLLGRPEYEAQFTVRSHLEIADDGKLNVATPNALFEIGDGPPRTLMTFTNPLTEEERKRIQDRDTAPPYHFTIGSYQGMRFWWYDQRQAYGLHDAKTNQVLVPAKRDVTIWEIDVKGELYYSSPVPPGTGGNLVQVRRIRGDQLLASVQTPGEVQSVASVQNGNWVVTYSLPGGKGEIWLLDRAAKVLSKVELPSDERMGVMSNSDSSLLAQYSGTKCEIRRVADLSVVCVFPDHPRRILDFAFSPDSSMAVTGSQDGVVRIFDTGTGELRRTILAHPRYAMSVRFTSDGKRVASIDALGSLKIWPVEASVAVESITDAPAGAASFSKSGNELLWMSYDGRIFSRNERTGKVVSKELGRSNTGFSQEADYVFVGKPDGTIRTLDVVDLKEHRAVRLFRKDDMVWPFSVLPGGKRILVTYLSAAQASSPNVSVEDSKEYAIVDAETLKIVCRFSTPNWIGMPRYSAGYISKYIAFAGFNESQVWLFSAQDGREVRRVRLDRRVYQIRLSPKADLLAISIADHLGATDAGVVLYDPSTGRKIGSFEYSGKVVGYLRFSPDGRHLVGSNRSGEGYLWDVGSRKLVARLTNGSDVRQLAFSPDGERIVSKGLSEPFFTVWDGFTGAELITLPFELGPEVPRSDSPPVFSRDGRKIVAIGADGVPRVWYSLPWKDQPKPART